MPVPTGTRGEGGLRAAMSRKSLLNSLVDIPWEIMHYKCPPKSTPDTGAFYYIQIQMDLIKNQRNKH